MSTLRPPNPPSRLVCSNSISLQYADNQSQVKLEFRYTATDDYYWSIDILQIDESESLPIPTTGPIGIGLLLAGLSAVIVFRRK